MYDLNEWKESKREIERERERIEWWIHLAKWIQRNRHHTVCDSILCVRTFQPNDSCVTSRSRFARIQLGVMRPGASVIYHCRLYNDALMKVMVVAKIAFIPLSSKNFCFIIVRYIAKLDWQELTSTLSSYLSLYHIKIITLL